MGLIHWWPLNGDTKDYGTEPTNINGTPTFQNNGKVGKTAYFNGSTFYYTVSNCYREQIEGHSFSMGGWYRHDTTQSKDNSTEGIISLNYGWTLFTSGTGIGMRYELQSTIPTVTYTCTVQDGKWHHIFCTLNYNPSGSSIISLYYDGLCVNTQTISAQIYWNRWYFNGYAIGTEINNSTIWSCLGWLNDLRIYNHCLSKKEIKELAQCLILHYDFEDEEIESTTNHASSSLESCFASPYNGSNGKYGWGSETDIYKQMVTFEGYNCLRMYMGTPNTTAYPYINFNGLNPIYETRPYVTLSFDYYPTVFDKIIPYSYRDGVIVSAKCNGKTFLENSKTVTINNIRINEWNHVEVTYYRSTNAYSDGCAYIRIGSEAHTTSSSYSWYFANVQIEYKDHATPYVSGSRSASTVYDESGYKHDGTMGNDASLSSDTILGKHSLLLNGKTLGNPNTSYITIPDSPDINIWTVNIWLNLSGWAKNGNTQCLLCGKTPSGGFDGYMKLTLKQQQLSVRATLNDNSTYNDYILSNEQLSLNTDYMLTWVSNGTTITGYINGEKKLTVSPAAKYQNNLFCPGSLGRAWSDGYWNPDGNIYDFKVFATALSDEDIKHEYEVRSEIDRNYTLYGYGIYEDPNREVYGKLDYKGAWDVKNTTSCRILGNTIYYGYNSVFDFSASTWTNDNTDTFTMTKTDNTLLFECHTAGSRNNKGITGISVISGHNYLLSYDILSTVSYTLDASGNTANPATIINMYPISVVMNKLTNIQMIIQAGGNGLTWRMGRGTAAVAVGDTINFSNIYIIDLTEWFGAGKEPSTVQEFKEKFSKNYYSYCPTPIKLTKDEIEALPSYGYNQLCNNGDFSNGTTAWQRVGEGSISAVDGGLKLTVYGWKGMSACGTNSGISYVVGHKYLFRIKDINLTNLNCSSIWTTNFELTIIGGTNTGQWIERIYNKSQPPAHIDYNAIKTCTSNSSWLNGNGIGVYLVGKVDNWSGYITIESAQVIDLTDWYGAGNEPATIEEFKATFPNKYYPYSKKRLLNKYMINSLLEDLAVDPAFRVYDNGLIESSNFDFAYLDTTDIDVNGNLNARGLNINSACELDVQTSSLTSSSTATGDTVTVKSYIDNYVNNTL